MSTRLGRALRGVVLVCLWLAAALPAVAQVQVAQEGVAPPGSVGVVAVAAGWHHSCALDADGKVVCWGNNDAGQSVAPTQASFTAISAGWFDTCGIRALDSGLICWGQKPELQQVPWGPFTSVAVSDQGGACALRIDGQAACWGAGYYPGGPQPVANYLALSASGDTTCGLRSDHGIECWRPESVAWPLGVPGGPYRALSVGASQVCGLQEVGDVRCWDLQTGVEREGRYGTFSSVAAGGSGVCASDLQGTVHCWGSGEFATQPPVGGAFTAMVAGNGHACGIRENGSVGCWGGNYFGEATPPLLTSPLAPVEGEAPAGQGLVHAVALGETHSCALRNDGAITCWGNAEYGQSMAPSELKFAALGAGGSNTCGVSDDGNVLCWGRAPLYGAPTGQYASVAVGRKHACGLRIDGSAVCWSDGPSWSLPGVFTALVIDEDTSCGLRPNGAMECWQDGGYTLPAVGGGPYKGVSLSRNQRCGLQENGDIRCWELYSNYERGAPPGPFVRLAAGDRAVCGLRDSGRVECWGDTFGSWPIEDQFNALSAGNEHFCGIRGDGTVVCWGRNDFGQATPPMTLTMPPAIAAGGKHTCALDSLGGIGCWGDNSAGQATPPQGVFQTVGSGERYSCALQADGHVLCWGDNAQGQQTAPLEPLSVLSVGRMHSCGLTADGHAHCWGWNSNGQATPPVGDYETFESISAGFVHTCAVRRDYGTGLCWGYNGEGQTNVPWLPWGQRWRTIQAGDQHSCGLVSDGTIQCWGSNNDGQSWPPPTGYFRALSVGAFHNCAIRTDGRLACWGGNWAGQSDAPTGAFIAVSAGSNHSCALRSDGAFQCWGESGSGQAPRRELMPPDLGAMRLNQPFGMRFSLHEVEGVQPYIYYGPQLLPAHFHVLAGNLPPGLTLADDGTLEGRPTVAGAYTVTIGAMDELGGFGANREYNLVVDGTPPEVYATVDGYLGDNGWYASNVYVRWSYHDWESSIWSGCADDRVLSDTPGRTMTCTVESAGGVTTKSVTIKRDLTQPETTLTAKPDANTNRLTTDFEFQGTDGMSGVSRYECSLDGAAYATCASPYSVMVSAGNHSFTVRAVDNAGNRDGSPATYAWFVDSTPPQIVPVVTGAHGNLDWYISDVQISWQVSDAESAVTSTGCNAVSLTTDSPGASFTCTATSVGGTVSETVTIKRDATRPVIVAAASEAPNAAGWYNHAVSVAFSCSDATSGVAGACPTTQLLDGEGALASSKRTITDAAGNSATSNEVMVQIDRTAPMLAPTVAPGTLLLNANAAANANGSDVLSGVASQQCNALATGTVGSKAVSCTVIDRAGNSASASTNYRVVYGFNGFNAPVQNPSVLNVIKAGRTIPLRWRVLDAQGTPVSNLSSASVGAIAISCPSAIENRISAYGGSNAQLQNLGNGYYQLDWMVASSLRWSCRRLELNLGDGEVHPALFKFN